LFYRWYNGTELKSFYKTLFSPSGNRKMLRSNQHVVNLGTFFDNLFYPAVSFGKSYFDGLLPVPVIAPPVLNLIPLWTQTKLRVQIISRKMVTLWPTRKILARVKYHEYDLNVRIIQNPIGKCFQHREEISFLV